MNKPMKSKIGLWIDHRQAIVVKVTGKEVETRRIISHMEKHVRFSDGSADGGSADDIRDRQFGEHLDKYYDRVVAGICEAESILIMGPGEAKGELAKRLERQGRSDHIVGIETVDKMTERQVKAKVCRHFKK